MVCMKSRTGRRTALTRSEREAQMPSGIAKNSVTRVATRTSDSVDMASDHSPTESTSARPHEGQQPREEPAQPPGGEREDAREQQRGGGGERGVDAVVEAGDERADGVEEPGQVALEEVDTAVDPGAEV